MRITGSLLHRKMTTEREQRLVRSTDIIHLSGYPFVCMDLLRFVCGDKLGEGAYRSVFEFDHIKNTVIKISHDNNANITEYEVWKNVIGTKHEKWFAPCITISPCGHFLIQKRVRPITDQDKLPKRMPDMFTDIKKSNFGFIGKQLVCHDYQFLIRAIDASFLTSRNVEWK